MTERHSQNEQILEMLNEMKQDIVAIKTRMDMQPTIDEQKHALMDQKLQDHHSRIKGLEDIVKWLVLACVGAILASILKIVIPS